MKDKTSNDFKNKSDSSTKGNAGSKSKGSTDYNNVEPLPESSRPRQDGPGGN